MPEAPREVLLAEDDPSIARFVEMALEDDDGAGKPVHLTWAASLKAATECLRAGRFDVVISDLQLGDGSGIELLAEAARRPGTRCVAFSANVDDRGRAALAAAGVQDVLVKPVSLDALRRAVDGPLPRPPATAPEHPLAASDPTAAAVADYFGGDRALFEAYRRQCTVQFAEDQVRGERSATAGDWTDLRHLAHSLKSVLQMLGDEPGRVVASSVEAASARADGAAAASGWRRLQCRLDAWRHGTPTGDLA